MFGRTVGGKGSITVIHRDNKYFKVDYIAALGTLMCMVEGWAQYDYLHVLHI